MSSQFGWVDFAEADRERMLNAVHLFGVQEARDELGLGTIRDAFANYFFPGTSTIQTRARYFLFVPWIYQGMERRKVASRAAAERARRDEVQLIYELLNAGETGGVIGQEAKEKLQRLPSAIYWAGLGVWGIRLFSGSQDQYHRSLDSYYRKSRELLSDDKDPLTDGPITNWHLALPDPPKGWPSGATFELRRAEATYLMDRILIRHGDSLLAKLLQTGKMASEPLKFLWQHPVMGELPRELAAVCEHACCFSEMMYGASVLYNLLLARKQANEDLIGGYSKLLGEWMLERRRSLGRLTDWRAALPQFWANSAFHAARINPRTTAFVERWIELVFASGWSAVNLYSSQEALELITRRELQLKGKRARLSNLPALNLWRGAAGVGQLDYRWGIAQGLLQDILTGLKASDQ